MTTKTAKARELMALSKYKLSEQIVLRRLRNGWDDEKIINRPAQYKPLPDSYHKGPSYQKMLARRGAL